MVENEATAQAPAGAERLVRRSGDRLHTRLYSRAGVVAYLWTQAGLSRRRRMAPIASLDLPFRSLSGYSIPVPRSRASRFASVALLLLAGSVEPAWEVGHALVHAEIAHDSHHQLSEPAPSPAVPAVPVVSALPDGDGHGHPVFHVPVKPSADLTLAVVFLPPDAFRLPDEGLAVPGMWWPAISARAGPQTAGTTQPRAPPLA